MQHIPRMPKESARDYAVRIIKYNIVNLHFAPGALVSSAELAEEIGLSRTPVREAMQELDKIGLVKVYPQAGNRVSLINYEDIAESFNIRLTLESGVVEQACDVLDLGDLLEFETMIRLQEHYLNTGQFEELLVQDHKFHRHLFVLTNRMLTFDVLENFQCHFDRVQRLSLGVGVGERLVADHWKLLEALRGRDKKSARESIAAHLSIYLEDERLVKSKYPEYFIN